MVRRCSVIVKSTRDWPFENQKNSLIGYTTAENVKDTLCRNVTIYGHCRYEEKGHDAAVDIAQNNKTNISMQAAYLTMIRSKSQRRRIRLKGLSLELGMRTAETYSYKGLSSLKKHLNVDSPSFTPSSLSVNGTTPSKSSGLSPKAAGAAPFKPKGLASGIDISLS